MKIGRQLTQLSLNTVLVFFVCQAAMGQGSGGGTPPDPIVENKLVVARKLSNESEALFKKGQWAASVAKAQESLIIFQDVDRPPGTHLYWRLARAQVALGNMGAADSAFKQMVRLMPKGELAADNFNVTLPAYIEFLADMGREEDAKHVYYSLVRELTYIGVKSSNSMSDEPFPVLIIFDQDSQGDYWPYTPGRIKMATRLAIEQLLANSKVIDGVRRDLAQELMDAAKVQFPGWYLPYAYESRDPFGEIDEEKIAYARSLTRSDREREWIEKAIRWGKADSIEQLDPHLWADMVHADKLRQQIPLLEQKRLELMANPTSVSCGKEYGKGF